MMPVHYSLTLRYGYYLVKNDLYYISEIAIWMVNIDSHYEKNKYTYLLAVGNCSGFRLLVLMAPNRSSIGATLYECGASNMNGTLRSFSIYYVLLLWAYLAPSWMIIVEFLQFLSSLSSRLTSSLIYSPKILESVLTYVKHVYISP